MTPTDFPLTFAALPDGEARRLEQAMVSMARFEREGLLIKAEFEGIKAVVSNALNKTWDALIFTRFQAAGRYTGLTEAERTLAWALNHPYPHLVAGYLKRARAFKEDGALRTAMIDLLVEFTPLSEGLARLKPLIGKRAPSKTSKTAIAEAERAAKAMTCQCCGRAILAETGVIAHHGYERPGSGWQTASCYGAKALPFEVDRARLGQMLDGLKVERENARNILGRIERDERPLTYRWKDHSTKVNRWDKPTEQRMVCTRETFDAEYALIVDKRGPHSEHLTFDMLKARSISDWQRDLRHIEAEIAYQQPRYDGWVQTHTRQGDAWVCVDVTPA